jgi:quercetin dioxygenase-like cupin family protein
MNLTDFLKDSPKDIATQNLHSDKGSATLLRIKKGRVLRDHQSANNAMLVLLSGKAIYEENDRKELLTTVHDFVHIPAKTTHKVTGVEEALLMLVH